MSNKKKIGILTFHNAHNYGAVLQAYALKTKLTRMGYEAKVLNYRNVYISRLYRRVFHIDLWKRDILPTRWGKVGRKLYEIFYGLREWQKQWDAFEKFITEQLLDGNNEGMDLSDVEREQCDVYVMGSDQIWARELTHGFDPAYFGQFETHGKRISYAASVPNGEIPDGEKVYFKQYLENFTAVSVREEKLAAELQKLTGRDIETVIDPTLLLDREDYEKILCSRLPVKEKYVFAYFVVESDMLSKCAAKAAERTGYRLIELHYHKTPEICGENMIFDAGPEEFLAYIRNAEMVLTNSFHGTVFSILFQKKFYSVYEVNGRISNLLSYLQLEKRHITKEEDICVTDKIDYETIEERLMEYRRKSIEYLQKGIEG